jgi:hypothetical protein
MGRGTRTARGPRASRGAGPLRERRVQSPIVESTVTRVPFTTPLMVAGTLFSSAAYGTRVKYPEWWCALRSTLTVSAGLRQGFSSRVTRLFGYGRLGPCPYPRAARRDSGAKAGDPAIARWSCSSRKV